MSGTSLDGVDFALCRFTSDNKFELIQAKTIAYPSSWLLKLEGSIDLSGKDLIALDHEYGRYLGELISDFTKSCKEPIDLISSHGHTVFHEPQNGFTLQIGNINDIYAHTNIPVINDFRSLDVSASGTGAPLVPIGDLILFPNRVCLNLGGIANISYQSNSQMIAYDVCPFNLLLNHYAQELGFLFDKDGELAKSGEVNLSLLEKLERIEFYKEPLPKSLDKSWIQKTYIPLIDQFDISVVDKLKTIIIHYLNRLNALNIKEKWLVTGGGANNKFFVDLLQEKKELEVINCDLIDFKEAIIFAFLGLRRLQNQPTTLKSVTGAQQDIVSGVVLGDVQHLY